MKTLADHRGIAIIFDTEEELKYTIDRLDEMVKLKAQTKKPYPAVYVYTDNRMSDNDARQFHDECWWMGFATQGQPRRALTERPKEN